MFMSPDQGLISKLQQNFDVAKAEGLTAIVQFEITDAGNSHMVVDNGQCQFFSGDHDTPNTIISMDTDTLYSIIEGRISGMQGFMFGKVKASGDQRLAAKLDSFFKKQNYRI